MLLGAVIVVALVLVGWGLTVLARRRRRAPLSAQTVKELKRARETMFNRGPVPRIAYGRRGR